MKSLPRPALRRRRAHSTFGLLLALGLALSGCGGRHERTHPLTSLSAQDRTMLQRYETIRGALAQDDVRSAKRTAASYQKESETSPPGGTRAPVADAVAKIASANNLEAQRKAFRTWSDYAISLTREVEGFYIIHCPLPDCGDWLQIDVNVDNPYMGKAMHDCGELQK